VGIRPLAWIADRQTLSFSSDMTGLCRAFSSDQKIDPGYLMGYFKFIDYRITPCKKVKKLLPGHFLHFSEKGTEIKKYWAPEKIRINRKLTHEGMISDMKSLLRDAVKIRCDSRFNAGSHVSSGLDSGIVSTLARKEYRHQETFYGFSWSPGEYISKDAEFDERDLVNKSCTNADIMPVYSDMDQPDFVRIVSSFYDNHGFFSEDKASGQAVEADANLIFSGWGGDEYISTGVWIIELDLLAGLRLSTFFKRNPIIPVRAFIKNMAYYLLFPAMGVLDNSTRQSFRDDARYLKKAFQKSDRKAIKAYYFYRSRHQFHLKMLHFYHLQDRCENWMISGYRKGIEYRYPLLDKRIIEYMLKVPSELLCKTDYSRPLLREISEGVIPEEVRMHRSKNDPVYWAWMDEFFREASVEFMNEVDVWRGNPDLYFIDFALLSEDIRKYKELPDSVDSKILFRALVYTKAIHEFTLAYRK
jgi:asparagine synthase (glutamine-hydrolysing)